MQKNLFRKKVIDKISSPDQLNDYLHISGMGVWMVLVAGGLVLSGLFVWCSSGTLQTVVDAKVLVKQNEAQVVTMSENQLASGMTLCVASKEYVIGSVDEDEFTRTVGHAEVDLPNGMYDAKVVTQTQTPLEYLLEGR